MRLLQRIRACDVCRDHLPFEPKPVLQFAKPAKILIVGQAPGTFAHRSGIPWDDKSGDRLRDWLGVTKAQFYDPSLFALVPMGFCYPGKGKGGDLPPRPECAQTWRTEVDAYLEHIELKIYAGRFACEHYFKSPSIPKFKTVAELVLYVYENGLSDIALPHPSPRNHRWLAKHPWVEEQVVPTMRQRVRALLKER